MNAIVPSFLNKLRVGEPTVFANLAVLPIFHEQNTTPDYVTLEEGLASDLIEVKELEDGASVNNILLRNKSDQLALLFEGEEFLGAMQNRVLNVSILVKANSKQKLPVSCVEAGRWHHEHEETVRRKFDVANRMHYAKGRAMENRAVSANLDSQNVYRGDQSRVWQDIEEKSARLQAASPTAASDAMYMSERTSINEFVNAFAPAPDQIGSIFVVNDEAAGLELYASATTHKQMLQRLVRSYALDAIDSQRREEADSKQAHLDSARRAAEEFVKRLENSWIKQFDGMCLGQNVRFKSDDITGGALTHDDRVMHLCAFAI